MLLDGFVVMFNICVGTSLCYYELRYLLIWFGLFGLRFGLRFVVFGLSFASAFAHMFGMRSFSLMHLFGSSSFLPGWLQCLSGGLCNPRLVCMLCAICIYPLSSTRGF